LPPSLPTRCTTKLRERRPDNAKGFVNTIWYEPVKGTLEKFNPEMVVLNGSEARLNQGKPITMGVADITAVREGTDTGIIVIHKEAINQRLLSREELRAKIANVAVPEEGETVSL
jgi:hypothetical protein